MSLQQSLSIDKLGLDVVSGVAIAQTSPEIIAGVGDNILLPCVIAVVRILIDIWQNHRQRVKDRRDKK